jgi:antitoxin component YwqK of YwqJK toxin-antitoxin module
LPWSLTSRLPITLEYKNAMGYDEDGYSGRSREWLELSNSWTADYRYFFTNGQVSQEGRVENGQRSGWWTFRNESGNKLKEIEYTAGVVPAPNGSGDTLHYKGRIKGYHPNGYLLYEGYVLDESFSYSCATETDLSFEDIWYTGFYDSLGNQTLQNNSGKVYDYHVNTVKRMEGFIRNGLYDSTWYRYSIGGTLESAGKYRNGKKDGRWLLGDLEGINFLDNQCFDAGDEWRMMQLANELDFTEEIWSDGKLIRTSTLNIKRDGSADDYSPASYEKKPWRWGKKRIRSIQERVLYRDHEEDDDDEFGHHRRRGFSGTPEF